LPDLTKVVELASSGDDTDNNDDFSGYLREATDHLLYYTWCERIARAYVGLCVPGVVGVFLFRIIPARAGVDEWIWVVVGDLPPAYLTCDECPNPATALDGYIGAMTEWVDAASCRESVANVIPVNMPATPENADLLRKRLCFLDERILVDLRDDL
jgi:hypothetical protein